MLKKQVFSLFTSLVMIISLVGFIPVMADDDSNNIYVTLSAPYRQTEARSMLDMINSFRTGSDAWAWNESDTEKVYYTSLGNLSFDYELEKIAMQRAAELVASYSHTRPDGSRCFTAYTKTYTYGWRGENIAIGTSNLTAEAAFDLWKEDKYQYSGQGHRRNMLSSNFNSVGIAHVYYKGCHYWVQEFSSVIGSSVYTEPVDDAQSVSIKIAKDTITSQSLSTEFTSIELSNGESKQLPAVYDEIRTSGMWRYAPSLKGTVNPKWSVSSGSSVVSISDDGSFMALDAGTAVLSAAYEGNKIDVDVSVNNSDDENNTLKGNVYYQTKTEKYATLRFIAEIDIEDLHNAESGDYSILVANNKITNKITTAYLSIIANGKTIEAPSGKCFIVTSSINGLSANSNIKAEFNLSNYLNGLSKLVIL